MLGAVVQLCHFGVQYVLISRISTGKLRMAEDKGLQKSTATTLVLVVLLDGARHGYDIAREVERRSENRLMFSHGTLYPVLYALEKSGDLESCWEQPIGERKRRVYALTDSGRREAEKAIAEWREFSTAMSKVIGANGHEQPA
ncbi:MAG: helix-turn-helix transcriptional regulator [Armatimonadetes bacterium]|nr:helix-turn-helix transcriptional regulator [Armatimonadota bacterium]